MPWYTVTKKRRGRSYLYRQRTYRAGGKVRTESQYIGPVDGVSVAESAPERQTVEPDAVPAPVAVPAPQTTSEPAIKRPSMLPLQTLVIQNRMYDRENFSAEALRREERQVNKRIDRLGLPLDDLKPIKVGEGSRVARRNKRDAYYVFAAKGGKRTAFKQEYRRALAARMIEQLEEHDPAKFELLRTDVDREHRLIKTRLTWMLLHSNEKDKFVAVIWYMWARELPKGWRKRMKAENLGLVDHAGSTWRGDTEKLAGDIIQHGRKKALAKYKTAYFSTLRRRESLEKRLRSLTMGQVLGGERGKLRRQLTKIRRKEELTLYSFTKAEAVGRILFPE